MSKTTVIYSALTKMLEGKELGEKKKQQSNPYYVSKKVIRDLKNKHPEVKAVHIMNPGGSSKVIDIGKVLNT